jgi:hypothetical protein
MASHIAGERLEMGRLGHNLEFLNLDGIRGVVPDNNSCGLIAK